MTTLRPRLTSCLLLLLAPLFSAVPSDQELLTMPGSFGNPPKPLAAPTPKPPEKGRQAGISVGVWIDPEGKVVSVEKLHGVDVWLPEVEKAVLNWRFEPISWEGKALPARTVLEFTFDGDTRVESQQSPLPNYPFEAHSEGEFGLKAPMLKEDPELILPLMERLTRGRVEVLASYIIEPDGRLSTIEIPGANSEAAYRAIIDQITNQVYTPASIGGVAVRYKCRQVISTQSTESAPVDMAGLLEAMDPIFPLTALISGTSGKAKVAFTLAPDGHVQEASVLETSDPEFGQALKAAIESWTFSKEAAVEKAERIYEHVFDPALMPAGVQKMVTLLSKGEKITSSGAGLDAKPVRIYSAGLAYPADKLKNREAGTAKIEFVIDRNGLAQIPRIVNCSDPDFGWAAATWIGSMRFKPLTRSGSPTEIRVSIPVEFTPPPIDSDNAGQGT